VSDGTGWSARCLNGGRTNDHSTCFLIYSLILPAGFIAKCGLADLLQDHDAILFKFFYKDEIIYAFDVQSSYIRYFFTTFYISTFSLCTLSLSRTSHSMFSLTRLIRWSSSPQVFLSSKSTLYSIEFSVLHVAV
jgi:hypothetical protein